MQTKNIRFISEKYKSQLKHGLLNNTI